MEEQPQIQVGKTIITKKSGGCITGNIIFFVLNKFA